MPGPAAAEAPAARRATDAGDREGRAGGAAGSEVGPRARRRAESLFERSSYQYTALLECIIYYNDYWIRYAHNVWHLACMSPELVELLPLSCGRCAARTFKFGFSHKVHEEICTSKMEQGQ